MMPLTVKGDRVLGKQGAQHGDLFLAPLAAIGEILVQGLIFYFVPTNSDPKAKSAAAEHIHLRCLFGDKGGLTLRKDDHSGYELNPLRKAGQVAEQYERLMEERMV